MLFGLFDKCNLFDLIRGPITFANVEGLKREEFKKKKKKKKHIHFRKVSVSILTKMLFLVQYFGVTVSLVIFIFNL